MKADRIIMAFLGVVAAIGLMVGCDKEKGQGSDEPTPGPGPDSSVLKIIGSWALVQDGWRVEKILEIDGEPLESCFDMIVPGAGCYFLEDEVYGSAESDGEPVAMGVGCTVTAGKISVPVDGWMPVTGRWDEPPAGFEIHGNVCEASWSLSGNTLTLGGIAYKKVTRFVGGTYSSITTTLEDNSITVGAEEQVVHIPYVISPAVPWGEVTASKVSGSFIDGITCGEGEVLVSVSAVQSVVSGEVALHYPGAPDLSVTIAREITRAIVPEWTSRSYDYKELSDGVLPFTIVNASSGYQAGVRVDGYPDWINAWVYGNSVYFQIAENNSGASRTARLILSYTSSWGEAYPPAPEVTVTITQTYAAPAIVIASSGETDCQAKDEIAVPLTVQNPHGNCELSAETDADWLNCSASTEYLFLSVSENQSNESRTATVTLRYHSWYESFEDIVATYSLTQKGIEPIVTLVSNELVTDFRDKGPNALRFYYNILNGTGDETFTDDADWIWYPNRGGWDYDRNCWWGWVQVDENYTTEARTGHVTIKDGNSTAVLTVIQTGLQSAIAMDSEMTTDYRAKSIDVGYFLVDSSLNADEMMVESSADWLIPQGRVYGAYRCYVGYNNSGAEREATLTLSIGTESSSIKIIQEYSAPGINVDHESFALGYQSGSVWLGCTVYNDRYGEEVSYESDADWVTFTPGTRGTTVNFTENKTNFARSATISLSYLGGLATKTVSVTQGIREYFDLVLTRQDNPGRGEQYHINWASCNVGATGGDKIGNYYSLQQAQSNLPSGSRLPTLGEWNDFQHAFSWTKTTIGGVVGFVATPKDESNAWIDLYFIPASGYYPSGYSGLYYTDRAFYWSSYPDPNMANYYWCAWFYYHSDQYGTVATRDPFSAYDRMPVRVVK